MNKKLEIPVGAAFEKKLAELIWESCPELARSTAAGKMALALDMDEVHISTTVVSSLVSAAEDKLLPSVSEQFSKHSDEIVSKFQDDADKLLKHTSKLLDKALATKINDKLDDAVQKAVVRVADNSLERLCRQQVEAYYNGKFLDVVKDKVDHILARLVESRLTEGYGRKAAELNDVMEKGKNALMEK